MYRDLGMQVNELDIRNLIASAAPPPEHREHIPPTLLQELVALLSVCSFVLLAIHRHAREPDGVATFARPPILCAPGCRCFYLAVLELMGISRPCVLRLFMRFFHQVRIWMGTGFCPSTNLSSWWKRAGTATLRLSRTTTRSWWPSPPRFWPACTFPWLPLAPLPPDVEIIAAGLRTRLVARTQRCDTRLAIDWGQAGARLAA